MAFPVAVSKTTDARILAAYVLNVLNGNPVELRILLDRSSDRKELKRVLKKLLTLCWRIVGIRKPIQFVIVFTLIFLLVTTSTAWSISPTPTPTRETVIQQIEEQAKRDLDAGRSALSSEAVWKQFQPNADKVGLSREEVDEAYVEAYSKAKDAQETDPQEQIKGVVQNPVGWLLVIVLAAFFALIKDSVTELVKKIWTTSTTWVYNRFSGNRLFWEIALRKYRKALVEKHQELKIPFRPNRPLPMAEVYVPLKVADGFNSEQIEVQRAIELSRRLMVKGQPGSGKTMLLKSLALSYTEGRLNLPDNPVVILLELHRLSDASLSIEQQLVGALSRNDFPNGLNFVQQGLERGMIMLLLDGLDEVNSVDRPGVVKRLKDFLDTYEQCRMVLTCRTQVYQGEFDDLVDQTLEVVEFSDRQIRQFLVPWKASLPPEKSVEQLLQALRERPRILELARNPLLLTIIAYLYADTSFVLPHSRAEFYQQSTNILIESWDQAKQTPNAYKGFTKRLVLQQLALFAQDTTGQKGSDRKTFDWQDVLAQVKAVLPGLNLDESKDAQPLLDELVERSGLLLRIDGGARYQFTHLTLQEFFAAAQLVDNPQGLIQRFEQDNDAWQEVVKLWCGLANDSTAVIRQVYASQPVMAFECLADAQNVDAQLADAIIGDFKNRLSTRPLDKRIAQAFGAVAADARPRGAAVFDFLVNRCESAPSPESRSAAVQALAYTNLPKAAQVLTKRYPNSTELRQGLVQLGDMAVPYLQEYSGSHLSDLTADLTRIGTPRAAKALVPYLWHSDSTLAATTAWYLTVLLPQPDIAEELDSIALTPTQKQPNAWAWVWEPFATPQNAALPKLAAQMADLLANHSIQSTISNLPDPDPRIVIPVCAFSEELQNNLPQQFPSMAEALLLTTGDSYDLTRFQQLQHAVGNLLKSAPRGVRWRMLLSTLSPKIQLDLLKRLINNRNPTRRDWSNLFRPVQYQFEKSWHYYSVVLVAACSSIGALIEMVYLPFQSAEAWTSWILGLPVVIVT